MKQFQNFFYYTRAERNGALALLLLCAALALAPRLFTVLKPPARLNFEEDIQIAKELPAFTAEDEAPATATAEAQLFYFDPNTATKEELMRLGLRERIANAIVNYRNKGGQFRKREDLQKIYTLSEADYYRLEPYIRIGGAASTSKSGAALSPVYTLFLFDPNTASEQELLSLGIPEKVVKIMLRYREKGGKYRHKEDLLKIYTLPEAVYHRLEPYIQIGSAAPIPVVSLDVPKAYENTPPPVVIDINQAAEPDWQKLKGIGPAYATRIVRFREALGGFASVEQVAETRGLPDSTFQRIRLQLRPSPILRRLAINTANAETLAGHPYIDKRLAEAIIAYRQQHGTFRSAEDLKKLYALKPELLEKLEPYLQFD